jgi:hypothetical protein
MFKITLSPQASDNTTELSVNGTTLTYNGIDYDLSALPINSQVEAQSPASGLIKNVDGVIEITVLYQYDSALAPSNQSTNKEDYIVEIESGVVPSPIKWKELDVQ